MAESRTVESFSAFGTLLFGVYLVALAFALGSAVVVLWSEVDVAKPSDLHLVLIVMLVGAVGSYVHAATSFASYLGNRRLGKSWLWWYLLRPFVGAALALLFYFVVRGGFLQAGAGTESLNLYGIAALAGLAGMFSKQATDKLREVFDNLFAVKDERKDKLESGDGDDSSGAG